jgi:geranylgeranyl pyrophosphate synthase
MESVLHDGDYGRVPFASILKLIERHRGIDRAMRRAEVFTRKSREIIAQFPDSRHQRALQALTDLVTDRDH